jgi:glycosyltransferase involved in cell wall biosynthesis
LQQIDDRFEVLVVDSKSTDGSLAILQRFEALGKIRLIVKKCSRGEGRQIAFGASNGEYVLANLDLDDVFKSKLLELIDFYHKRAEGYLLWVRCPTPDSYWGEENVTIAPSKLLAGLGGWRDLQFYEDWELCARAARQGVYRWTKFDLLLDSNPHLDRRTFFGRYRTLYIRYRDSMRCNRRQYKNINKDTLKMKLVKALVLPTLLVHKSYREPFYRTFSHYDEVYHIE